jgi:hypothetical protein
MEKSLIVIQYLVFYVKLIHLLTVLHVFYKGIAQYGHGLSQYGNIAASNAPAVSAGSTHCT